MRVVLRSEVAGLGRPGDVKDVADGYAQNYLVRKGLAVEATAGELKRLAQQATSERAKKDRAHADAAALAERLDATTLAFTLKAGKDGKTFGSVTTKDIAEALKRVAKIEIERTKIHLDEPLRTLGVHRVEVRLLADVRAKVTVAIEPER
ncbi:MAG: 50S ribosomal protein L9 [Chloroflexi bacterium]|nr:50S ribosomal protein L9 [Chloroflexota bacterium]MDQ3400416.1 50S ribosomal protein L9 [Chloroflexota bacterium]